MKPRLNDYTHLLCRKENTMSEQEQDIINRYSNAGMLTLTNSTEKHSGVRGLIQNGLLKD